MKSLTQSSKVQIHSAIGCG